METWRQDTMSPARTLYNTTSLPHGCLRSPMEASPKEPDQAHLEGLERIHSVVRTQKLDTRELGSSRLPEPEPSPEPEPEPEPLLPLTLPILTRWFSIAFTGTKPEEREEHYNSCHENSPMTPNPTEDNA
ncbi:hypothetical protein E2C01_025407 [Portunus trituberculatus]|uniref:Uncharacterized protein n=1 Tax=Portunus trituberculatus TaxID=210409 RepID=A0A5B7EDA0_PORTR|nr:hypothetical protein [Portunus trituberculatus]